MDSTMESDYRRSHGRKSEVTMHNTRKLLAIKRNVVVIITAIILKELSASEVGSQSAPPSPPHRTFISSFRREHLSSSDVANGRTKS